LVELFDASVSVTSPTVVERSVLVVASVLGLPLLYLALV